VMNKSCFGYIFVNGNLDADEASANDPF